MRSVLIATVTRNVCEMDVALDRVRAIRALGKERRAQLVSDVLAAASDSSSSTCAEFNDILVACGKPD